MKYLAINTAGPKMEIALAYEDKRAYFSCDKVQSATQLWPEIDRLLDEMNIGLNDIDDFVCVVGPGSFTGIRIGIVAMRTIAYALKKNVFGVTYSRLLAYNTIDKCTALIDGGNGVCYIAAYDGDETVSEPVCIYKKDVSVAEGTVISDYETGFSQVAVPNLKALMSAAEYAIRTKSGTEALYIRKPQPERKENDI